MQQTRLAELTTRIAALPDWCYEPLAGGVLGLLEYLAFDPEQLIFGEANRLWTALALLNGDEDRLEALYAAAE
jgi:hypothetical protein